MLTVVEFYECYYTWRILAENHIGITLDELLNISQPEEQPSEIFTGMLSLDSERCETMLSIMELYIDAYEDVLTSLAEHLGEKLPEGVTNIDTRAEKNAEQLATEISCPL
ncbi:hypothetical protein [Halocatena salina]|uniref:Uncharacterized protein n=1 Tax=Halocatena salina TaxID=2934340 RepID=A0A8U0A8W3_9EURY|nr:hypothetical protein [Halocatena salina]UPM45289.1 hypothetical protein MW046_19270 [Halocatena salina]